MRRFKWTEQTKQKQYKSKSWIVGASFPQEAIISPLQQHWGSYCHNSIYITHYLIQWSINYRILGWAHPCAHGSQTFCLPGKKWWGWRNMHPPHKHFTSEPPKVVSRALCSSSFSRMSTQSNAAQIPPLNGGGRGRGTATHLLPSMVAPWRAWAASCPWASTLQRTWPGPHTPQHWLKKADRGAFIWIHTDI